MLDFVFQWPGSSSQCFLQGFRPTPSDPLAHMNLLQKKNCIPDIGISNKKFQSPSPPMPRPATPVPFHPVVGVRRCRVAEALGFQKVGLAEVRPGQASGTNFQKNIFFVYGQIASPNHRFEARKVILWYVGI